MIESILLQLANPYKVYQDFSTHVQYFFFTCFQIEVINVR